MREIGFKCLFNELIALGTGPRSGHTGHLPLKRFGPQLSDCEPSKERQRVAVSIESERETLWPVTFCRETQ